MCGCDDDCCGCISYRTRENIKYGCICFAVVAVVVLVAVLLAAYAVLLAAYAVLLAAYAFLRHITITVEDASLTRFALLTSPTTALVYNLPLTLSVHNLNWVMTIRTLSRLKLLTSSTASNSTGCRSPTRAISIPPRKTIVYRLVTGSESDYVSLGDAGMAGYNKENQTGVFEVEVALDPQGKLHGALHQMQDRGHLPAQAADRAAWDDHEGVREGGMQACQGGEELLDMN